MSREAATESQCYGELLLQDRGFRLGGEALAGFGNETGETRGEFVDAFGQPWSFRA